MDLTYVTILVLASMVFVLAGMIGYVYWQQTRIIQHIQSLSIVVSSLVNPPSVPEPEPEPEAEAEQEQTADIPVVPSAAPTSAPVQEEEEEEDDRVSVEHVSAPPSAATEPPADVMDTDDLQTKTKAQLQKMLGDKGIPYAKSDNKTTLIELLKATA